MKNFMILTESIEYIEQNLCEPITRGDIAAHCYVSLSSLEKLFRYALTLSIGDYISRRRITRAAKDISSGMSVSEAAMKYRYNSIEVFSRAFRRVWQVNPSNFKGKRRFTGIFPKINYEYKEGEKLYMARKRVDISEAYDFFKQAKGSYVLCVDGKHFNEINKVSRKAGDMAILEIAARLDGVASDDMVVIRIGGDEFALVTGIYDEDEARVLAQRVLDFNGQPIIFEGGELPLSLWCGITKIPELPKFNEFFTDMHTAINESKNTGKDVL